MSPRCPSDLALEKFLLAPEESSQKGHVDFCASCQARLAEMKRQGEEFMQFVFPATVDAIEAAAERKRFDFARWFAPIPALAAAAAIVIMASPTELPEDQVTLKGGGGLGLAVFTQGAAGAVLAHDGQAVPANASLRFKVRPTKPCRLWVVSVDASGEVSRLFPTQGDEGYDLAHTNELPGGAVLDGQPGPERIMAFCAPSPVPFTRVASAISAAASASPETVRHLKAVPGLPAGTTIDSVLLEKKP